MAGTERRVMTFRIDSDLVDGLQRLFERDGISQSESIRRALRMWLDSKDVGPGRSSAQRNAARRTRKIGLPHSQD
jgi:Arc/MetJ-type ribon-helix-helix transcriptional regulator